MLINEVCKKLDLTKKAIEYYIDHNLITPTVLANGYREFSSKDLEILNKINVLRKLDITVEEIKSILNDSSNATLNNMAVRKELDFQCNQVKKVLFQQLAKGKSYDQIKSELNALDQGKIISEKLLEAFPGYYGRFLCLHFAHFLNVPIQSESQQKAYKTIITFLDDLPVFDIPEELMEYINQYTSDIDVKQIKEVLDNCQKAYADFDVFLTNNKEFMEKYLELKKSAEYQNSLAYKLTNFIKEFNSVNGYNEIFIPAMRQLSPAYEAYYQQMLAANEKLLKKFPEIRELEKNEGVIR